MDVDTDVVVVAGFVNVVVVGELDEAGGGCVDVVKVGEVLVVDGGEIL